MMKIIEIDKNNPYIEYIYDMLDKFFYYGYEYLPSIFLHDVLFEGQVLQMPKWISKRHYDSIDNRTQSLMKKLNSIRLKTEANAK